LPKLLVQVIQGAGFISGRMAEMAVFVRVGSNAIAKP
jgi:hypothetical protein